VNVAYLALEVVVLLFFSGAALAAWRRGRLPFLELISAAGFGLLLEEGDQLIFRTYHYSAEWVLDIDRAPIAIGLTWALIIAGAMRLTDALGVRRRYAPAVDAVLAISLDLAFDAIAIRMGLWTWTDVDRSGGWFGVPWGNFYAWLIVTAAFSVVTRWVRDVARDRPAMEWLQLAVPIPAFALLLSGLMPFRILKPIFDPGAGAGGGLFAIAMGVFGLIAAWGVFGPNRGEPDGTSTAMLDLRLSFLTRLAIHGFFLAAFLAMGLAAEVPVLLAVALALLATEVPLQLLVRARRRNPEAVRARMLAAPASALD
jgi:uncharacterized membrane protein